MSLSVPTTLYRSVRVPEIENEQNVHRLSALTPVANTQFRKSIILWMAIKSYAAIKFSDINSPMVGLAPNLLLECDIRKMSNQTVF